MPRFILHQPEMVPAAKAVVGQGTSVAMCPVTLWPAAAGQRLGVSHVAVLALPQPAGDALPNAVGVPLATFAVGVWRWSGGAAVGTITALCCSACGQVAARS